MLAISEIFRVTKMLNPLVIPLLTSMIIVPCFAQVSIELVDENGDVLVDAAVVLSPLFEVAIGSPQDSQIEQINEQFVPRVKVVQVGANIFFPNQDQIRHHVYSFSEAKQFDIPLYSGTPSVPIQFDQAGLVVLGCNIHDQMRGYLLVSESPLFSVSNAEGIAEVLLPTAGEYELNIWHPEQKNEFSPVTISIGEDLSYSVKFEIETAKLFFPRRGSSGGSYF
jgi:plastocyanin